MDKNGMKIAYLRALDKTSQCDLTFHLTITHEKYGNIDEDIRAVRQIKDCVESLLAHTKRKIIKLFKNNGTNSIDAEQLDVEMNISLTRHDEELPGKMVCTQLLQFKRKMSFKIFGVTYRVIVNAPLILQMKLPTFLYVNSCIQPVRVKGIHFDKRVSKYTWSKSKEKENWTEVFYDSDYNITMDDLNHYIKVTCLPLSVDGTAGPIVEVISKNVVEVLPEEPALSTVYRRKYTENKLSGKSIRVVTYNTLSEQYAVNQFEYCNPRFLSIEYRKKIIFDEIKSYNADIICLQEVDYEYYNNHFKERFKDNGYIPTFHKKGNVVPEGLCFAYDRNRFKKIDCKHIVLSHEIRNDLYRDVWNLIKKRKDVKELFLRQNTSLLVAVLKLVETNDILIVANTHLYYHMDAAHIRMLQIAVALRYLKQTYQITKSRESGKISVIFCGDFNSKPDTPAYHYLTEGSLKTWTENLDNICGGKSNVYQHGFNFRSACGTPQYTNYTEIFKDCLDYIFCQRDVKILQSLPFPPEEELSKQVALPSQHFPSDHIAVVADLML